MRMRPFGLVLPALVAASAFAGDRGMTGATLDWKPTSSLAESMGALNLMPFAKTRVWVEPFTDTRPDKGVIGENQEKSEPRTVSTNEDTAAFLTRHTSQLFREAGLPMAAKAGEATVVVSAEVVRYKVVEKDTYKGELNLLVSVTAGGKLLWKGMALGEATRWGRSFKLENYHEALSDSLVDAVGKALKSPAFLDALAGKEASK